ncbi:MAG: hypothetical protein ACYSU0_21765 [Planctomycetota bacterium]|jgi:hypothetical protein
MKVTRESRFAEDMRRSWARWDEDPAKQDPRLYFEVLTEMTELMRARLTADTPELHADDLAGALKATGHNEAIEFYWRLQRAGEEG